VSPLAEGAHALQSCDVCRHLFAALDRAAALQRGVKRADRPELEALARQVFVLTARHLLGGPITADELLEACVRAPARAAELLGQGQAERVEGARDGGRITAEARRAAADGKQYAAEVAAVRMVRVELSQAEAIREVARRKGAKPETVRKAVYRDKVRRRDLA
jgi:ketosteroid isomerase-like protein